MWNFVLAAANAFAANSAAQDQNAARQEAYERQRAQDAENRRLAKEDASNKFVDMRNAAQKAGFNPLTALRMTGAAGFGAYGGYTAQVPVLSKVNFGRDMATSMLRTYATMKINEPIDKYNKEIRDLEIEERRARIDNTIANTGYTGILAKNALTPKVDEYAGYGKYIPVMVGKNKQLLNTAVAKRLGILPNTPVTAGEMAEIKGEFWGEIGAAIGSEIGDQVLLPVWAHGTNQDPTTITTHELPPVATEPMLQRWVDNIWNAIEVSPVGIFSN